ncbi:hypothetical protein BDY19DRAFT_925557 [Irpex rosettiformis]|uniref:Uncharacterized protein n=1 Tax=Irpex rosettiformis TaxID=378272 RepID=A0ACB8UEJ1_9APHY|nr:hypothetical protein BDY19DRAFT_925557 [Irpex rosettiformis]
MTQLFKDMRTYAYVAVVILSITVLGIAAYQASIFLPDIQHDFGIFAVIVPSLTILAALMLFGWSRPWFEAIFLFICGVLWLGESMGAWEADILGSIQCDALGNQRTATKNGSISTKSWCYEMRVIEAFSWLLFCLFVIFLWILITLTSRAQVMGRPYAWSEPIFELPWFGQYPGMPESMYGGSQPVSPYMVAGGGGYAYPAGGYPAMAQPMMMPTGQPYMTNNGYVVPQQPGHSVVIQPNGRGQPPTITQVPGVVSTA